MLSYFFYYDKNEEILVKKGFLVKGLVQGVGFRYFALKMANKCGIKGYVKNLDDGSVEIGAFGSEEAMSQFEKEISVGPSQASVFSVKNFDVLENLEDYDRFEIQY
jgi:acylphosphatase